MPRYALVVVLGLSLAIAGSALAAPPNNGYIGVYGDAAGTLCCFSLNPAGNGHLYYFMTTAGATAAGFSGIEFRASIEPSASGVTFTWTPPGSAGLVSGNPIDNGTGGGVYMFFPTCQTLTGLAGDRIPIGSTFIFGMKTSHQVVVRMHSTPSSPSFACPTAQLCDGPAYTMVCLTLQQGDPALGGDEPAGFTSAVNNPTCSGVSCGFVPVEGTTWTQVKDLYR